MHEHHVAHRYGHLHILFATPLTSISFSDCTCDNIMMDASSMYPQGFHPAQTDRSKDWKGKAKHLTRTQAPPRYLLIDFGHARRYDPKDGPPLELPLRGGDKSAPEHSEANYNTPCDPFPTDVYYLGNFMREELVQVSINSLYLLVSFVSLPSVALSWIRVLKPSHPRHGQDRAFRAS